MAHFAQLNSSKIVIQVLVVGNDVVENLEFPESEELGLAFLAKLFPDTQWKQTSYNANFRKNYAGIGHYFDEQRNAFVPPKPGEDWVFDELLCNWVEPESGSGSV